MADKRKIQPVIVYTAIAMAFMGVFLIANVAWGFSMILFLLAMAVNLMVIMAYPEIGLYVIILSAMLFERFFTLEPVMIEEVAHKVYPLDFLIVFTVASLIYNRYARKLKPKFFLGATEVWLLIFMMLTAVYFIANEITRLGDGALAFSAFKNYAFYALLYFLIIYLVQDRKSFLRLFRTLLIGGVGVIFFVLVGMYLGEGLWTEFTPLSTEGTRLLSFPHAFFMTIPMLFMLALISFKKVKSVALWSALLWLQLAGVLGSLMRHLWLALFAGAVVLFVAMPKKLRKNMTSFLVRNMAVAAIFAAIVFFLAVMLPFSDLARELPKLTEPLVERTASFARATMDESARWRLFAWQAAQDAFVSSPIVGIGYGRNLVIKAGDIRQVITARDLHNSFIVLLVQMGLVGFVAFAMFNILAIRRTWSRIKKSRDFAPYLYAVGAAYAAYMVAAFFQPYFETNITGIFFWIILGMMGSAAMIRPGRRRT